MNARHGLGLLGLALTGGGIGLAAWGVSLPIYRDRAKALALWADWCGARDRARDSIGERYDALFTWHYTALDGGVAMVLAGATLLGLTAAFGRDGGAIRTPAHRDRFNLIGVASLAALVLGTARGLFDDLDRLRFPTCADSIAIPLSGLILGAAILVPGFVLLGWLITRSFRQLPVSLLAWDRGRPAGSWLLLVGWGAMAVFVGLLTVAVGISADRWSVPGGVVALYLLASTRAALSAPTRAD